MKKEFVKFNPGDIVSYCGEEAEVVQDYGDSVKVKMPTSFPGRPNGYDVMSWYKVFQGEPVILVKAKEEHVQGS